MNKDPWNGGQADKCSKAYDKHDKHLKANFSEAEQKKIWEKHEKSRQREVKRKKIIACVLAIVVSAAMVCGSVVLAAWLKGRL